MFVIGMSQTSSAWAILITDEYRIQAFAGIMHQLLGWQPQHNHYHADLECLEILGVCFLLPNFCYTRTESIHNCHRLWHCCKNQLILFGCCPQRNELHSRIVCDWLWPNVTYKECGCSKISSHSNLSLVFIQPSQFTRCCQLCARRRWKKYQMLPAVCTKKVEEIIFQWHYQKKFGRIFWKSVMKYTVWYPASIFRM